MPAMDRVEKALVNSPVFTFLHGDVGQKKVLALARPPIQGPLLEIGCGQGATTERLMRRLPSVEMTALDFDPDEVARAERRLAGRAKVMQGDARKLAFPDASFATVVEMNALHHIAEWREVLPEVRRVLRPGGQFLFMDYTRRAMGGLLANDRFQPGRFTASELAEALEAAGFHSVRVQGDWVVFGRAGVLAGLK